MEKQSGLIVMAAPATVCICTWWLKTLSQRQHSMTACLCQIVALNRFYVICFRVCVYVKYLVTALLWWKKYWDHLSQTWSREIEILHFRITVLHKCFCFSTCSHLLKQLWVVTVQCAGVNWHMSLQACNLSDKRMCANSCAKYHLFDNWMSSFLPKRHNSLFPWLFIGEEIGPRWHFRAQFSIQRHKKDKLVWKYENISALLGGSWDTHTERTLKLHKQNKKPMRGESEKAAPILLWDNNADHLAAQLRGIAVQKNKNAFQHADNSGGRNITALSTDLEVSN